MSTTVRQQLVETSERVWAMVSCPLIIPADVLTPQKTEYDLTASSPAIVKSMDCVRDKYVFEVPASIKAL